MWNAQENPLPRARRAPRREGKKKRVTTWLSASNAKFHRQPARHLNPRPPPSKFHKNISRRDLLRESGYTPDVVRNRSPAHSATPVLVPKFFITDAGCARSTSRPHHPRI